ncbi:hypothetical protein SDC9_201721 [bioreactor metagenome]|uniref:Uncharacterized protein n=1 Tax=bioreactor metagenome TaxID=1076179 RepID=A0A645IT79_9ZZZZ
MHRDLMSERVELFRAGYEVCLAVKFEEDREFRVIMDIGEHPALGRGTLGLLGGLGKPLLAKVVAGFLHIPGALYERLFAVHHAD